MAFREVTVVQIREALRCWLRGAGERTIARTIGVDRKTARRYIAAAVEVGLDRAGGEAQLTDELIGRLVEAVRPQRTDGHGAAWRSLLAEEEQVKKWVKEGLTVVKIGILLERRGVVVPHRTLARFAVERCGAGKRTTTVRVDDPPPGTELQVDFGRLGLVPDGGRRRVCHGLIFTACFSRHQFVWPTFLQTTEEVIRGFEAAWGFFGGVFPVVIPDNMKSIVVQAEHCAPRFNDVFLEYTQDRGFMIDAARVRTPTDKPRVERVVHYVQHNFFAGESFVDLADCRARAETWCATTAGMRVHGTTQVRPAESFRTEELALLLPVPGAPFDTPVWSDPKLHRDCHVQVAKALYSASYTLVGRTLRARRDSATVKLYLDGELVKVHPRVAAGQRSTDPADFPPHKGVYATRDVGALTRMAAGHGPSVGAYARAILDTPLPWTKMRQVYRLVGLAQKWGSLRLDRACRRALDAEAVDVNLIARMLERAQEDVAPDDEPGVPGDGVVVQGRFQRDPSEFSSTTAAGR
ncbi:MAG: IS21 family transposase [Acidimicrobiales bacterium]